MRQWGWLAIALALGFGCGDNSVVVGSDGAIDATTDATTDASGDAASDGMVDACASNPCMNGGSCTSVGAAVTCDCADGYEGDRCQTDTDECAASPCMNGGTCTDEVNGFSCECAAGYNGEACDVNIDDCAATPCENGGTCTDEVNGFSCECPAGYSGNTCSGNIDDCDPNPCLNGSSCTDGVNGFTCTCEAGYSGATCEVNVDDCASMPCMNGGTCTDEINSYSCECPAGFEGSQCQTNIDECVAMPCMNGGTCTDGVNSRSCECPAGYTGASCETNIDECESMPCMNGGTCTDGVNSRSCECPAGYSGASCETNVDECVSMPCMNGGTCTDGVNSRSCECPAGYTGASCETRIFGSCLQILMNGASTGNGDYLIDVDGAGAQAPITVYCDMTTDGGGYTFYAIDGTGLSTNRFDQPNSCTALGMNMVITRTEAHYNAMIARYNDRRFFRTVPGIYGLAAGNYTTCTMNSNSDSPCSTNWRALDGGSWWLRNAPYSEPNGDYTAGAWLGTDSQFPHERFNDGNAGYSTGNSYICSTNDKGRATVASGLAAHYVADVHARVFASGEVQTWHDISGNARHLTPGGALPPVFAPALINGNAAMNFDGANRRMNTAAFNNSTDMTVFAAVQWRTAEVWGSLMHHGGRDFDWSIEQAGFDPNNVIHFQSGSDNSGAELTLTATSNYVLSGRIQGTARTFDFVSGAMTGAATATGNTITVGPKNLYVGSSDVLEDSRAYVGEVIYYTRALTDNERAAVIRGLRARWGI